MGHQVSTSAEGSEYRNALQRSMAEAARQEIGAWQPALNYGRHKGKATVRHVGRVPNEVHAGYTPAPGANFVLAGSLRKGMRVVCHGKPGVVEEVTLSKSGKHGHAKAFIKVLGDNGTMSEDVIPTSHDVELAQ